MNKLDKLVQQVALFFKEKYPEIQLSWDYNTDVAPPEWILYKTNGGYRSRMMRFNDAIIDDITSMKCDPLEEFKRYFSYRDDK